MHKQVDGKRQLLMAGSGASPEGNRPFLDLLDLETKETQRLWQSSPPYLESTGSIMSDANVSMLTIHKTIKTIQILHCSTRM